MFFPSIEQKIFFTFFRFVDLNFVLHEGPNEFRFDAQSPRANAMKSEGKLLIGTNRRRLQRIAQMKTNAVIFERFKRLKDNGDRFIVQRVDMPNVFLKTSQSRFSSLLISAR